MKLTLQVKLNTKSCKCSDAGLTKTLFYFGKTLLFLERLKRKHYKKKYLLKGIPVFNFAKLE